MRIFGLVIETQQQRAFAMLEHWRLAQYNAGKEWLYELGFTDYQPAQPEPGRLIEVSRPEWKFIFRPHRDLPPMTDAIDLFWRYAKEVRP